MPLEFTPLALPLLAAAAMNLVLARYAWVRQKSPGALAFAVFMGGMAGWSALYILVLAGTDIETKMLWYRIEYLPIAASAIAFPLFTVQYAGWSNVLRPRIICLLLCEPIITV